MKFYKPFRIATFLSIATILLVDTASGQNKLDTSPKSKTKKSFDTECELTDSEKKYIFTKVEILSTFKGFSREWFKYAQNNFDFASIGEKLADTIQTLHDSIFLKFIVTKTGLICNIEVLKGNNILSEPAIKLLKQSSPWTPALNGERYLNAYRILKIEVYIDKQKSEYKIVRDFNSYLNPDG